jgi:hypothetical protein
LLFYGAPGTYLVYYLLTLLLLSLPPPGGAKAPAKGDVLFQWSFSSACTFFLVAHGLGRSPASPKKWKRPSCRRCLFCVLRSNPFYSHSSRIMKVLGRFCWLFLLLAGACKAAGTGPPAGAVRQQDTGQRQPDYQKVAEQRLGKGLSYSFNQAGTLVLGQQVEQDITPAQLSSVRLVVIRVKDNAILYEDRLANARVEWFNDTQLRIYLYPGAVRDTPGRKPSFYLFDLQTKEKSIPPSEKL